LYLIDNQGDKQNGVQTKDVRILAFDWSFLCQTWFQLYFLVILKVVVMLEVSIDDDDDDLTTEKNFRCRYFLAFVHSGWSVCDSFQVRR